MSFGRSVAGAPASALKVLGDLIEQYRFSQKHKNAKCLYIMGDRASYLSAELSDDLLDLYPKHISRRVAIKGMYTLEPENIPFFIIHNKNPETLKIGELPKKIKIKDEVLKTGFLRDKNGKVIKDKKGNIIQEEVVDVNEYEIPGADVMTSVAYRFARSDFMQGVGKKLSNRERLITFVMGVLFSAAMIFGYISLA